MWRSRSLRRHEHVSFEPVEGTPDRRPVLPIDGVVRTTRALARISGLGPAPIRGCPACYERVCVLGDQLASGGVEEIEKHPRLQC